MKPKLLLRLALVLSGVAFFACPARAQPIFPIYRSLETQVAEAQSIFCGSVSNCSGTFIERQDGFAGGYRRDGTERPKGVMKYTITVQINETIKGSLAKTIELVEETEAGDNRFEQWAGQHTTFLFFIGGTSWSNLGGNLSETNGWHTIRLGAAVPGERFWSSDAPVFLMDFTCLTNSKAILAETRKAARIPSHGVTFHKLYPMPGIFSSSLIVPVEPALEKIARRLIVAPESFWPASDRHALNSQGLMDCEREGVEALRYFKSARNVRLLKSLLGRSESSLFERQGETYRQFPVQSAAYEVLTGWGVEVPKPVMEEKVSAPGAKL